MADATDILQTYLDDMARHVFSGDFASYRDGVALPFHLVTASGSMVVETQEALRVGFDAFHGMLVAQRVTDYIRLVSRAERLDPQLINGSYVTHMMAGALRIAPPFASQIVLRQDAGGRWRGASIANAVKNATWPIHSVSVATDSDRSESGR